jgi:hypothetical protein
MTGSTTRRDDPVRPEPVGHGLHDGGGREHARLRGGGPDVLHDGVDLRGDELWRKVEGRLHAECVLNRDRRDRGRAEHPERGHRSEIRLDAGAAGRVRAGYGEGRRSGHVIPGEAFAILVAPLLAGVLSCSPEL